MILDRKKKKKGVNFDAQNNFYEILNISSKNKQNPRKKDKILE